MTEPHQTIIQTHLDAIISELSNDIIQENKLRNLASKGIPDNSGHRGVIWRILLQLIPFDKSLWEQTLKTRREV
jgi:hypothetical protein